jgi:beta-lactamase class A
MALVDVTDGAPPRVAAAAGELGAIAGAAPFPVAWCLRDLVSGAQVSQAGDRVVPAASTRKVGILAAALGAVERGTLALDQDVVLDGRHRDEVRGGVGAGLHEGVVLQLVDVLRLMVVVSDNLCTAHVVDLVGLDAVNATCAALGMTGTVHRHALQPELPRDHPVTATNTTTADDQVRLLVALHDRAQGRPTAGLDLDPAQARLALAMLRAQVAGDGLPGRLPPGAVVAHKPGRGRRDAGDVGLLGADTEPYGEPDWRCALAVYCDELPERAPDGRRGDAVATERIALLARAAWDTLVGT